MLYDCSAFFNAKCLAKVFDSNGRLNREEGATFLSVLSNMALTVSMEYKNLPDYRTMSAEQIRFFYYGLESVLEARAKQRSSMESKGR